jgi:hypothetical protein
MSDEQVTTTLLDDVRMLRDSVLTEAWSVDQVAIAVATIDPNDPRRAVLGAQALGLADVVAAMDSILARYAA